MARIEYDFEIASFFPRGNNGGASYSKGGHRHLKTCAGIVFLRVFLFGRELLFSQLFVAS